VDHAGKRSVIQGARLKRRGIIPGIHDLFAFCDGVLMTFELKAGKNDATGAQQSFSASIRANRGWSYVCWTIEDIEAGIRAAGLTPQAMVMTPGERDARLAARSGAVAKSFKPQRAKPSTGKIKRMESLRAKLPF
jgi:hypothetical protein